MKWGLPHLRLAGLALPLLTAGCMSGVMPGAEASDPSCVLLCALTRSLAGDPAPPPVATVAPAPKTRVAAARPVRKRLVHKSPPQVTKAIEVPPARPRKVVAHAHLRPIHRPASSEVSVVPQASARAAPPVPVAIAPAPPVASAPPPAAAPRTLSQAIPGSAGIMVPSWQEQ